MGLTGPTTEQVTQGNSGQLSLHMTWRFDVDGHNMSGSRGRRTNCGEELDDTPDGPQPACDLSGSRSDGAPNESHGGVDDLEDGERLDNLCERADGRVGASETVPSDGPLGRGRGSDRVEDRVPQLGGCRRLGGGGELGCVRRGSDVDEQEDEDREPGGA